MDVSVIIPVYNAARFVRAAVASALAIEHVRELILIEDGSPDDSLAVCRELERTDQRVKLIRHPGGVNQGASASRNLGMRSASCAFVAFLDADDVYLPHRFDAEVDIFRQRPDAEGVYGAIGVLVHDAAAKDRFDSRFGEELTTIRKALPPEQLFHGLSGGLLDLGHFSLDALTIKRSALLRMPQLLREDMVMHEDSEFLTRLSFYCRLHPGSITKAVALRGVHDENRVTRNDRIARTRLVQFEHLLAWSLTEPVPADARERFRNEVNHYRIRLAALEGRKAKALYLLLKAPSQWKRPDSVHALIDAWGDRNRPVNRALHMGYERMLAFAWRLRGAEAPKSTMENSTLLRSYKEAEQPPR
jgi:glycosyltransferase involved in cell wall biosynthesis